MKKYLFLFLCCVAFIGCNSEHKTSYVVIDNGSVPFKDVVKFVYEGHDYIEFATQYGFGDCAYAYGGVVHNPDCKKCNNLYE